MVAFNTSRRVDRDWLLFLVGGIINQYRIQIMNTIALYENSFNWNETPQDYYDIIGWRLVRTQRRSERYPYRFIIKYFRPNSSQEQLLELTDLQIPFIDDIRSQLNCQDFEDAFREAVEIPSAPFVVRGTDSLRIIDCVEWY